MASDIRIRQVDGASRIRMNGVLHVPPRFVNGRKPPPRSPKKLSKPLALGLKVSLAPRCHLPTRCVE